MMEELRQAISDRWGALRHVRRVPSLEPLALDLPAADPDPALLFCGDLHPGSGERRAMEDFIARWSAVMPPADAVIANLETPLVAGGRSPLQGRKPRIHSCEEARAVAALRGLRIRAVTLANNHAMDHGAEGLAATLDALAHHGICGFGAGPTAAEAARPLVIRRAGRPRPFQCFLLSADQYFPGYDHRYGFYARRTRAGVQPLILSHWLRPIADLRRRHPDDPIVVLPHWGWDRGPETRHQRAGARALVEAGADLVIGHHPHDVQGVERHLGGWIFYGIGSVYFPGIQREGLHGWAVRVEFPAGSPRALQVTPYPIESRRGILAPGERADSHPTAGECRASACPEPAEGLVADPP